MSESWTCGPVVLIGAAGMLGGELACVLRDRFGNRADRLLHLFDLDLNICEPAAVSAKLAELRPSVVINAAAYTNVDGCEADEALAHAVNATGVGNLAAACGSVDAKLVHISTDFVFDGTSTRPYRPDDRVNPLSAYGRTKLAGEKALTNSGCRYLLVRTSWLFGLLGKNFVEAILARAESGEALTVVTDQVGCPTLASDLAGGIADLLDADATGVVHFCNSDQCSWHGFAEDIVRMAGCEVAVNRMTSDGLDRPAERPAYSVLDTTSFTRWTGSEPRPWREALADYLRQRRERSVSAGSTGSAS